MIIKHGKNKFIYFDKEGEDMILGWWEIGNNQNLVLSEKELNFIKNKVKKKFGPLNYLSKKLFSDASLYNKLKYKKQGMTVRYLKKVLDKLKIPYSFVCKDSTKIGVYKLIKVRFPLKLTHFIGELLAHSFFDGYANQSILRYSNYQKDIRDEFISIIYRSINHQPYFNNPKNIRRDIDLPSFYPRLLKSMFNIKTFYGDKCRISYEFFKSMKKQISFGWCFLKGAYLDEGTITGKQIWIVRGIKNELLIEDIKKLCDILSLNTKIRITNRGYQSLVLKKESYERFYNNINRFFINKVKKWEKIRSKIIKWKEYKKKNEKVFRDCKKIINFVKNNDKISLNEVSRLCNISSPTALARANILVFNNNLRLSKENRKNIYYLKKEKINNIPTQNEIKRKLGWR